VTRVNTTRAAQQWGRADALEETAAVYDRVRFGLGIPHGAMDALQDSAERAFVSLRQPLGPWARAKGMRAPPMMATRLICVPASMAIPWGSN